MSKTKYPAIYWCDLWPGESIMVNCARANSTIAFISMPNVILIQVMIETAATASRV